MFCVKDIEKFIKIRESQSSKGMIRFTYKKILRQDKVNVILENISLYEYY